MRQSKDREGRALVEMSVGVSKCSRAMQEVGGRGRESSVSEE